MALRDTVRAIVDRFLPPPPAVTTEKESREKRPPKATFGNLGDAYYDFVEVTDRTRRAIYDDYYQMDDEVVEVSRALDDHADLMTGSPDGDVVPVEIISEDEKIVEILNEVNSRTKLPARLWSIAREMVLYGDDFEEIVVDSNKLIVRVKGLPVREMNRHEDEFGRSKETAYTQNDEAGNEKAHFKEWQIVHFRSDRPRSTKYGRGLLRAARRVWRQLQLMEDGMVIMRLARAPLRYAFKIPGGDLPAEEQMQLVDEYRERFKKRRVIDPATGKISLERAPLLADDDFFIPMGENFEGGVDVLNGQQNLEQIKDVEYFQNKMFSRLEIPKGMLGYEKDINAKSTLMVEDVHLARKINRRRGVLAAGLRQIYDTQLMLLGIDPVKAAYLIKFPQIATDDELNRANIEKAKAETGKIWNDMAVPIRLLLIKFLGLSEDEVDEIEAEIEKAKEEAAQAEKDAAAAANPIEATEQWLLRKKMIEQLVTFKAKVAEMINEGVPIVH